MKVTSVIILVIVYGWELLTSMLFVLFVDWADATLRSKGEEHWVADIFTGTIPYAIGSILITLLIIVLSIMSLKGLSRNERKSLKLWLSSICIAFSFELFGLYESVSSGSGAILERSIWPVFVAILFLWAFTVNRKEAQKSAM